MKKRMLKDVEVSAIGMGCMGFSHAEGKQTDIDAAAEVIRKAVDMGYTFFNTGWNYGNVHDPHHKGGSFAMGSPENEPWRSADEAQHTVTVSDFYISPYEVRQSEYAAVTGNK